MQRGDDRARPIGSALTPSQYVSCTLFVVCTINHVLLQAIADAVRAQRNPFHITAQLIMHREVLLATLHVPFAPWPYILNNSATLKKNSMNRRRLQCIAIDVTFQFSL